MGEKSILPGKGGGNDDYTAVHGSVGDKTGHTAQIGSQDAPVSHPQSQDGERADWRWNYY